MTRRTLYLHIGSHRTATKSTQQFLLRNFERLIENGYFLPFRKPRHIQLMNSLLSGNRTVADAAADIHKRADSKPHEINNVILSDEDICMRRDLSILGEFRQHFDSVKIMFTLRRQDIWLESWYFQNVKWQWNESLSHCTFDEFLNRREEFHWIHYHRYVTHLEEVFGAENVLLNVFEKNQMPDGPVAAFCRKVGIPAMDETPANPHVNSSMSASMVEFMRHLPLDEFKPPQRELVRRALEGVDRTAFGHDQKHSERLMPPDLRRAILAEYAEGNQALARRYFDRDALFLEPLPDDDAPLAELTIPEDSKTLINTYIAPLLRHMVNEGMISAPAPAAEKGKP